MPVRDIAGVIGRRLGVPLGTRSPKKASGHLNWLAPFLSVDNPVSSKWTQEQLGWRPPQRGLIQDLEQGSYFDSRKS